MMRRLFVRLATQAGACWLAVPLGVKTLLMLFIILVLIPSVAGAWAGEEVIPIIGKN